MRAEVAAALTRSAAAFHDVVWPAISLDLGGGALVPVESVTSAGFAKQLDVLAGVDAWQVVDESGMRPLASRVQAGWGRINTFTIRWSLPSGARTEIDKRIDAIRDGYLYPAVTVQAYLDCPLQRSDAPGMIEIRDTKCRCREWSGSHGLLSVGYVDTVVLYEYASWWRSKHGTEDDLWKWRDGGCVKDVEYGNKLLAIRWANLPDTKIIQPGRAA
jgi:hypothetical protein